MSFEFEPVKVGPKASEYKRQEKWRHIRKTVMYMLVGIFISIGAHYLMEGWTLDTLLSDEVNNAIFTGAFVGFFLTNSPCARGRC